MDLDTSPIFTISIFVAENQTIVKNLLKKGGLKGPIETFIWIVLNKKALKSIVSFLLKLLKI